jgi:hypothetical protein
MGTAMVQAFLEKPGSLEILDAKGRRHVVSVFAMGKPQATGASTTYIPFTSYESLFVRCALDEVREAANRARTLRKAETASASRAQLSFDFDEKREASAVTPAPRITLPPEESVVISE